MSSTFDPSERLTYSASEIQAYLDTIALPQKHRRSPIFTEPKLARSLTHGLPLLAALQKHQLASIPFENLTLHYNPVPSVTIVPSFVHEKFIGSACGRGGRCMENNLLFYTVLLSLGFEVTSIAGRVNEAIQPQAAKKEWKGPRYDGWNHRITLVHFSSFSDDPSSIIIINNDAAAGKRTFLVDTGFGATCPNQPLELDRSAPSGSQILNVPPEQASRIRWTTIPDVVDKGQRCWVYEIRHKQSAPWTPAYCFTETEFLPSDYQMMSFYTSNNRRSWFTYSIVCVKMLLGKADATTTTAAAKPDNDDDDDDDDDLVIVGDITLFNNQVKRRLYGVSEVVETLETEKQRVEALKTWLGVSLTEAESEGIKGMPTAL